MPQQQNPERGSGDAHGVSGRPRNPGHDTDTPDAPRLPRPRREVPLRPPLNATPPPRKPGAAPPRATPPGGRPQADPRGPTRVLPGPGAAVGPGTPAGGASAVRGTVRAPGPPGSNPPGSNPPGGGPNGGGPGGSGGGASGDPAGNGTTAFQTSELSVNKVVAGAGAAIVTAILGSFLGAVGTILGAALGSIITTFATTFFQRSIEQTRTRVASTSERLKERKKDPRPAAAGPPLAAHGGGIGLAGPDGQETVRLDPPRAAPARASAAGAPAAVRPPGRGRRIRMSRKQVVLAVVGALLAFGLAMFLVTGIEWIKGGTITGGNSGTSVGNVVSGTPARQQPVRDDTGGTRPSTSESATPTGEPTPTSTGSTASPSATSGSPSGDPLSGGLNGVLPSAAPESGQLQSGSDGSGGSGGATTGPGGGN